MSSHSSFSADVCVNYKLPLESCNSDTALLDSGRSPDVASSAGAVVALHVAELHGFGVTPGV